MIVKLRAMTKVAKKFGLYVSSVKLSDNLYATGQTIIPGDKDSENNLSFDEVTGKKPLSSEKTSRFPYIIDPFRIYSFEDGHVFDLEDPRSKALFDLIIISKGNGRVALSKKDYIRGAHDFYLENKEKESEEFVSKFDLVLKAGNLVNSTSKSEIYDLLAYISMITNNPSLLKEMSYNIAYAELVSIAQKNPQQIIDAKNPSNKVWIVVSKMVANKIITQINGEYYEGKSFISSDVKGLVNLYQRDVGVANRWNKKYEQLKNKTVSFVEEKPVIKVKEDVARPIVLKFQDACMIGNNDDAIKYIKELRAINSVEANNALNRYDKIIKKLEGTNPVDKDKKNKLSKEELLKLINTDKWGSFIYKFKQNYPESDLKTKEKIIEFLKS